MNVSSIGNGGAIELATLRMGELLKNITTQQIGMENKMLKVTVTENLANTGHNVDFRA